jgi:hypothetical protein
LHIIKEKGVKKVSEVPVKNKIDSSILEFLQKNVLNITDLTRTNKLSEILSKFSGKETDEVFIVQNNKNKTAMGVLVDLEHYMRLLKLEEQVEQEIDDDVYELALERKDDEADIPLNEVISDDNDIDYDYIFSNFDDIELEE